MDYILNQSNDFESKVLVTSRSMLDPNEYNLVKQIMESDANDFSLLDKYPHPACSLTYAEDSFQLEFTNMIFRFLSDHSTENFHQISLTDLNINYHLIIPFLFKSFENFLSVSYLTHDRMFFIDSDKIIKVMIFPLGVNKILLIMKFLEIENIGKAIVNEDTKKILEFAKVNFIIINNKLEIIQENIEKKYSFLSKNSNSGIFQILNEEILLLVTKNLEKGTTKDFILSKYYEHNNFNYSISVNINKIEYDYLIVFKIEELLSGKFDLKRYLPVYESSFYYPSNELIEGVIKKMNRYHKHFDYVFDDYYKTRKIYDLNLFHDDLVNSIRNRQFNPQHLVKVYLSLILSKPYFALTRKNLTDMLVNSNLISYSVFAKLFSSIGHDKNKLIYKLDKKIYLNPDCIPFFNEILFKAIGLQDEIHIEIISDESIKKRFTQENDLILNISDFCDVTVINIQKKVSFFSNRLTGLLSNLKKTSNGEKFHQLNFMIPSIPWIYATSLSYYTEDYDKKYLLLKNNENSSLNNDLFKEEVPSKNKADSHEVALVLNFQSSLHEKSINHLKQKNIDCPIVSYFDKSKFEEDSIMDPPYIDFVLEIIEHDLVMKNEKAEIETFHIFGSIDFEFALKLYSLSIFDNKVRNYYYISNDDSTVTEFHF